MALCLVTQLRSPHLTCLIMITILFMLFIYFYHGIQTPPDTTQSTAQQPSVDLNSDRVSVDSPDQKTKKLPGCIIIGEINRNNREVTQVLG